MASQESVLSGRDRGGESRRFVGFGLGPIQAGLMLLEAMRSGNFSSFTVAEVDQDVVEAVRTGGDRITVNVASGHGIESVRLDGLVLLNPRSDQDLRALVREVSEADEMATAIPSVAHYGTGGESSIAALLARGIQPGKPQVLYAAENHNYAAELLGEQIEKRCAADRLTTFRALNTVIGKMSGVISDRGEMRSLGIAPVVPGYSRAILVEEFSRILISRPNLAGYRRGIEVFEEKEDLLPFEEAKLFGHNAIHSLLGYLAWARGYAVMSEIRDDRGLWELGLGAFLEESGAPLCRKHAQSGERLFTPAGYEEYARDLLERMTNPFLHDRVERICRDPARKLGYSDRLFGTMRLALRSGLRPHRLAQGAAAALRYAHERGEPWAMAATSSADVLRGLWGADAHDEQASECIALVGEAERLLDREGEKG